MKMNGHQIINQSHENLDTHKCPSCGSPEMSLFYSATEVPVHSVLLLSSREEALNYQKGMISLGFCLRCGFISNLEFDPNLLEYSSKYEATQAYSSTFNAFHKRLANQLIDRFDLIDKEIIEIGCGQGEFLHLLCEMGGNRGIGFDPVYDSSREKADASYDIRFIKDFYSEKYLNFSADFICCKMTLEHIQDVGSFINIVRNTIGNSSQSVVFFQVPNAQYIFREVAFWDIYYEHCSYFTQDSLANLFRQAGFDIIDLWTDYDDQYLMIGAQPAKSHVQAPSSDELDVRDLHEVISKFTVDCSVNMKTWQRKIQQIREKDQKIVVWGSGSKAVAFLNSLGIDDGEIEYIVDINPLKEGTFSAGTGQEIVAPEYLQTNQPDVVLAMNPVYRKEISSTLQSMGLLSDLITVKDI